jgi:hypothetical protein
MQQRIGEPKLILIKGFRIKFSIQKKLYAGINILPLKIKKVKNNKFFVV